MMTNLRTGALPLGAALCFLSVSGLSDAATIELTATEDSLTLSNDNTAYHTVFDPVWGPITASETTRGSGYWSAWFKFDLSPLAGMNVTGATLRLTTNFNHTGTPLNHDVFSSSVDSWSEGGITGANQPGGGTLTFLDAISIPNVNAAYDWNVGGGVTGAHGLGGANNLLTLTVRPQNLGLNAVHGPHFIATEAGANAPRLIVTVEVPEPTTVALMLVGISVLAHRRGRRA